MKRLVLLATEVCLIIRGELLLRRLQRELADLEIRLLRMVS